jgi:Icc protein
MSEPTKTVLGIVTDTHYWKRSQPIVTPDGALQLQPWSDEILDTLVSELHAAQVDQIIHLGDLVCGGGGYEMPGDDFNAALEHVHQRLHATGIPAMALPGNHDAYPDTGDLRKFHALWQYEAGVGKTIDLPQARLILLNAMGHTSEQIEAAPNGDPVYGYVSAPELVRLDDALSGADGRPVLVFCHQLLAPWTGRGHWRDFYGISNAEAVMAVLERHVGIRAVIQGHAHRLDIQEHVFEHGGRCMFGIMPGTIEYPVAWVRLSLSPTEAHFQLKSLPLPEIRAISERSGGGQRWRQGDPAWWDFRFPLA